MSHRPKSKHGKRVAKSHSTLQQASASVNRFKEHALALLILGCSISLTQRISSIFEELVDLIES